MLRRVALLAGMAWMQVRPAELEIFPPMKSWEIEHGGGSHEIRCSHGENATILLEEALMVYLEDNGGRIMRLLIICAIVITAGVGLAGCFHHEQAVVAEPISHTPLK
jgi:hypothetical protein